MLGASQRLRSSREIREVVHYGRRIQTPFVRVHFLRKPNQLSSRVACVVGTRVHRSAVVRHRYQRWLRQYAREFLAQQQGAVSYDIVFVAVPAMNTLSRSADLKNSLTNKLRHGLV